MGDSDAMWWHLLFISNSRVGKRPRHYGWCVTDNDLLRIILVYNIAIPGEKFIGWICRIEWKDS